MTARYDVMNMFMRTDDITTRKSFINKIYFMLPHFSLKSKVRVLAKETELLY